MKQYNFKNIAQKLQNAKHKPSDEAWQKMELLLNKPKSGINFKLWIADAAVLLMMLSFTVWLLKDHQQPDLLPQVVEKEQIKSKTSSVKNKVDESTETHSESLVSDVPTQQLKKSNTTTTNTKILVSEPLLTDITFNNTNKTDSTTPETPEQKQEHQPLFKVNPATLLSAVEAELDDEHKNETLKTLEQKFKNLKETIVNRNYEP